MEQDIKLKTLYTALNILELFTTEKSRWSIAELQKKTGLPKANIYRMLYTFKSMGYLEQNPENGKYCLTAKMYFIGSRAESVNGLLSNGGEYLYKLHNAVKSTTTLNFLDGTYVVHTDVIPGEDGIVTSSGKLGRVPAYLAASGLAILAASDETVIQRFKNIEFKRPLPNSLKDYEDMLAELKRIRVRRYSINNEMRRPGVFAMAMPIIGKDNKPVGSFSVSCHVVKLNEEYVLNTFKSLQQAARGLSYELGYDSSNSLNSEWFYW